MEGKEREGMMNIEEQECRWKKEGREARREKIILTINRKIEVDQNTSLIRLAASETSASAHCASAGNASL